MNKISDRTKTTVVKIFINSVTVMSFMTAPLASHAQTNTTPATNTTTTTGQQSQLPQQVYTGESAEVVNLKDCNDIPSRISRAQEKISTACRKAGMGGGKDCVDKVIECDEVVEEESFDNMGSFSKALGSLGGTLGTVGSAALGAFGNGDTNKSCPQMSGRDYFEEKERIEKDLKKAKEDIAKLDEERSDAKKEYDDAMKEINEDLAKAQEEAKEKGHEIDEDTQKQVTDFQTSQAQAAKDMRSKKADILTMQGQLISLDRQKATSLIDLTNYTAQSDCKKKMYDAYAAYKRAVSAGSLSSNMSKAKEKKTELINIYNKCMEGWEQKRMAVNETFRDQRKQLEQKIIDANADVAAIEDGLKQSAETLNSLKNTASTKKSEALQSVIALGERSQQQMQAAYEQLQLKTSGISKKETALNEEMNQLSNQLMTLGPAPKKGTDYAPQDAMADIDAGMSEIELIEGAAAKCPQSVKDAARNALKKYGKSNSRSRSGDK